MQSNSDPARTPVSAVAREWAWQQDVAPPARKLVLLAVCEHLNHGTGVAWPGADYLAGRCGLNRRQTHVHLTALLDSGLLLVVEHRHGKGRPYPVYTVPPLVHLAAQTPQVSGGLSAVERTKLVQPTAQTFVQPTAPEPLTTKPTTVDPVVGERSHRGPAAAPHPPPPAPPHKPPAPPAPSKNGQVIDLLRAAGCTPTLRPQDHAAIKASPLTPAQIAEVYTAIAQGRFTDPFMAKGLTVQFAISRWDGYQAGQHKPTTNGKPKALDRYSPL